MIDVYLFNLKFSSFHFLYLKGKGVSINNFYISNVGSTDSKQNKPNPLGSLFEPTQNFQIQTQRPIQNYQTQRPEYYVTRTQRPLQNIQPSLSTSDSGLSDQCLKCICNV
jgi:hypothetical protein